MKTLQVGLKCLHYMFDVNVDKFDSTHIHKQFDSQGWLKCLHYKFKIKCLHYKFNSNVHMDLNGKIEKTTSIWFLHDKDFNDYNCHNFHKKAHVLSTWTFTIYITGNLT